MSVVTANHRHHYLPIAIWMLVTRSGNLSAVAWPGAYAGNMDHVEQLLIPALPRIISDLALNQSMAGNSPKRCQTCLLLTMSGMFYSVRGQSRAMTGGLGAEAATCGMNATTTRWIISSNGNSTHFDVPWFLLSCQEQVCLINYSFLIAMQKNQGR